jgi:hypothetical protein
MMVRQTFIEFYSTAGPVYSGVVMSEPRKAKDQLLLLSEVNYLECSAFSMALGLKKCVDIILNGASWVFGPVDIPYNDWGFQSVEARADFLSNLLLVNRPMAPQSSNARHGILLPVSVNSRKPYMLMASSPSSSLPSTRYTELQTGDFTFWCKRSGTSTDDDEVDMEVKMFVCPSVPGIALGPIKNPVL